jgi:hypothetical protein
MLATHELLDRLELIYPDNPRIKDLRRSFIDHDLSSLFRLKDTDPVRGRDGRST